ncbi:MAG: dTDP-4-dehydrorhamnose reductase [Bacteroidota bacterium]
MKILVTGAYGQLGNEIKVFSEKYPDFRFIFTDVDSLDITNENHVREFFEKEKPEMVVNCAAFTAVDKAETEMEAAQKVNAKAPALLAKYTQQHNSVFIHISTDYVFNGKSFVPYSETDPVQPESVYGKTKLAGENFIMSSDSKALIIRTSWLYSSYGNNFVKTMLRLGAERDLLKVVFDQVGTPTYAADLAKAVLKILSVYHIEPGNFKPGIYHFSNEGVASWYDFAQSIFEISGLKCQVMPVLSEEFPTIAKRPHYSVLNKSKIKSTFNLEIPYWKVSLETCLKKLLKKQNNGK